MNRMPYAHGWFQVAFESELTGDLTPISIGANRFVIARHGGTFRAFDGDCPHRGAHLGLGGRLDGDAIICPFHAYRIGLGRPAQHGYCLREYPLIEQSGLLFIRLSGSHDNALSSTLSALAREYKFVPALTLRISAPVELVIENGFDRRHFDAVHRVTTKPFTILEEPAGSLSVKSTFGFSVKARGRKPVAASTSSVSYDATLFSPGVFLARLGGVLPFSYSTLTTATDHYADGTCIMRLSLILPYDVDHEVVENLRGYSLRGIEDDRRIWEGLNQAAATRLTADDQPVVAFQSYCERFRRVGC